MNRTIRIIGYSAVLAIGVFVKQVHNPSKQSPRKEDSAENSSSSLPKVSRDAEEELEEIVQRMIDADEPESNIAAVIKEYSSKNKVGKSTSNRVFELNGKRFTYEELQILANQNNISVEELFSKNPDLKEIKSVGNKQSLPNSTKERQSSNYSIRQLSNGDSPYDKLFGSGRYAETQNSVLVKASSNSDVVFILIDVNSGRKIRNEYIKRGTTFNLTKIPYGTYDYMYYSGLNWSDDYSISNSIKGGFTKNSSFTKNSYSSDRIEFERGYYGSYEITLYEVANGNLETKSTSASEFFN